MKGGNAIAKKQINKQKRRIVNIMNKYELVNKWIKKLNGRYEKM